MTNIVQRGYEPVIGLEVHVELNTHTKMFCRCSADYFGATPNTHTCPVCLGLPGALPVINSEAIRSSIKIGLALNCSINETSYFERKNYFYPDLAKGFQTSQLVLPVAITGWIDIENAQGETRRIRINRAHQEEDTGKLTHAGENTLIDFNRSGVPLVEIVTEPDFKDTAEIRDYAKKIQQICRYLGVSNADMERGDMRLEANVSVRKIGDPNLPPYRVELKNINSFRFMAQAVEYEIKRQVEATEKGEKLVQETRGWDEDKRQTYVQRSKEEAHDYRYFPEPDLPQMDLSTDEVNKIKSSLPKLPWNKAADYVQNLKLSPQSAKILTDTKQLFEFFDSAVEHGQKHQVSPIDIANYIINKKVDIESILPTQIIEDIKGKKTNLLSDPDELTRLANLAIEQNPDMVESYKKGKTNLLQALIGQVMRLSGGKADVGVLTPLLKSLLDS